MGEEERGVRTGTGPYKGSFRRIIERKLIGRRKEAGEICPREKKISDIDDWL